MAKQQRYPTRYAGVYYVIGQHITDNEKTEHIFYIRYKRDGKLIEEKAGRQYQDGMTAAKANAIRALRLTGRERSNEERRQAKRNERGGFDERVFNAAVEARDGLPAAEYYLARPMQYPRED